MTTATRPGRRRRGARLLGERGAAAVEFALVVPVLVIMLLGIVEYSKAFQVQATLSAAAREGARVMALTNDVGQARSAVTAAASTVTLTSAQVTVTPTTCTGVSTTTNVTVTIRYRQTFASGFLGGSGVDIYGRAAMRCGG